ncbi:MAG: ABC transporter substrate-binding protein [Spirochaetaceae bacterium]|jgi:peptide/nickel transport system substrate-binding protein|nr:ABC transporter substrate-binding protein [Spirochaetaceae bacterium]
MKKNLFTVLVPAVLIGITIFTACRKRGETVVNSLPDTLNVVVFDDASQFNPLLNNTFSDIMSNYQIYERLVYVVDGKPVPGLAQSWTVSPDGRNYTFTLRANTTFHDGSKLTAEDVIFSFESNLDRPSAASSRAKYSSYRAVDENTVEVVFAYPLDSAFSLLASPGMGIVSKTYVQAKGNDAWLNPVGTGAYKLKEWIKGSRISFEAFDTYSGTPAAIKYLNFNIIKDASTALVSLETGDNHFLINLQAASIPLVEDNRSLVLQTVPSHSAVSLILNTRQGVLTNQKLRQAIAHAINRETINEVAFEGSGTISGGSYSDFLLYDGKDYTFPYDKEKARQLLADAGYSPGEVSFTIKTADVYGDVVPQIIQDNLAEIGINVDIQILEIGAHSQDWLNADFEVIYQGGSEIIPDLAETLYNTYHWPDSSWSAHAPDRDLFNAELDALHNESDTAKKTELASRLLGEVLQWAGEIPLVIRQANIVYRNGLTGTYVDPNGMFYCFKDFSWKL